MNNLNGNVAKTKGLTVYSIICLVLLYGGLACSYGFWKNYVNGQFGLVIPFTFLFFLFLNVLFKIPSLVDIILLAIGIANSAKLGDLKSRNKLIIFLITVIISDIICVIAEFLMLLNTHGSSLG